MESSKIQGTFASLYSGPTATIISNCLRTHFLIPTMDDTTAVYLSSGAIVLGIIAVGGVLSAQIVSTAKQNGIVSYQRTLPVSRFNLLLADFIIWGFASLPGILMSFLASSLKFGLAIHFSVLSVALLILAQMSMISIGFCIAYWLPANGVSLMTQIIMIGGLLFHRLLIRPIDCLNGQK